VRPCCPPGHGCNAAGGAETCALELCRAAAEEHKDAALALKRWTSLVQARERGRGERECRFRRRAFERARDRALIALAMQPAKPGWRGRRRGARRQDGPTRPHGRRAAGAAP
jgi:hypothetical protein